VNRNLKLIKIANAIRLTFDYIIPPLHQEHTSAITINKTSKITYWSTMWKIFVCGSIESQQEGGKNWLEDLRRMFKEKFSFFEIEDYDYKKKEKNEVQKINSLNRYIVSSQKEIILLRLSEIKKADLVLANVSKPSFEMILQLIYSHLIRKPIILFIGSSIKTREISYISLISDEFFPSYESLVKYLLEINELPSLNAYSIRDILLRGLQEEVQYFFSREDIKDPLFRAAILTTQIGQLNHYLTHDSKINPGARSVGSRADEEVQLGDGLVQLLIYGLSRGFNLDNAYSIGIKRMEEAVWRHKRPELALRELRPNEIGYGISASRGEVTGRIAIIESMEDITKIREGECIVAIPMYQKPIWDEIAARIEKVIGLISGTGTPNIHPAIICRELKKPCIVGAKDLILRLRDNEVIKMYVGSDIDDNSVIRFNSK